MKERTEKSLKCKIYHELASMKCAHVDNQAKKICFCNKDYHVTVAFHENCILELSVEDKETGGIPFYLHFQMKELETSQNNIRAFFDFFSKKKEQREQLNVSAISSHRPIRLLISCTSGMTSSYFAYTMQNSLNTAGLVMTVDAVSYTEIDKVQEAYDYILLAPQVAYKLSEYQAKYGSKVMSIDAMDFASSNVNRVVNKLMEMSLGAA